MAPLSRERILETATRLADREGFEAVTLRRIAAELDVHVTSLYNHVPTRESITDGIVERLIDEAELPLAPVDWEEWVRRFTAGIGEVAEAHPGAFSALQRRPVQGARATASFEIALAAFTSAGFDAQDAYGAIKATTYVALSIGVERGMRSSGHAMETAVDLLPAERFPHLHSLRELVDSEAAWAFSLETLVSGLHDQLRLCAADPAAPASTR